MKKLLCILLALCASVSLFSCQSPAPSADGKIDISKYSIVRPDNCSSTVSSAATTLKKSIADATGCELEIVTDWVERGTEVDESGFEILIGKTNRSASADAVDLLKAESTEHSYTVRFTENKIVLVGNDDESTLLAIKSFIDLIESVSDGSPSLSLDKDYCFTDGTDSDIVCFSNLALFTLEQPTTIYGPTKSNRNVELTYARILMLEHSGENNGTLLATAESLDEECYIIHRSTDGGSTWEIISRVRAGKFGGVSNWQPMIYELPCEVDGMPEGTLLLAGCTRSFTSAMTVWKSTDGGVSWEEHSTVATSNGKGGLWEPFLICDEDGTLLCFYSSENDTAHSQKLVFKEYKGGGKWKSEVDVVASPTQHHRPGMITIARLGNGKYIATYEMVGLDGTNYYKITDSLTDWNAADIGKQIRTSDGKTSHGTPYCAWSPAGSSKGTLIMSGKFEPNGQDCGLFISFNYGKSWEYLENPMPYTNTEGSSEHRFGYSPGFYAASDGTIYYVNCVDTEERAYSSRADMKLTVIRIN